MELYFHVTSFSYISRTTISETNDISFESTDIWLLDMSRMNEGVALLQNDHTHWVWKTYSFIQIGHGHFELQPRPNLSGTNDHLSGNSNEISFIYEKIVLAGGTRKWIRMEEQTYIIQTLAIPLAHRIVIEYSTFNSLYNLYILGCPQFLNFTLPSWCWYIVNVEDK